MPEVGAKEVAVLRLWGRCKDTRSLPYSGGVLEQPGWLMEMFDVVEAALAQAKADREENERNDEMKKRMEAELV